MARVRSWCVWLCVSIVAGSCANAAPPAHCVATQMEGEIATTNVGKLDLLFVVSDAPSMAEEQLALRQQLPAMVRMLVTGDRGDGSPRFPPVEDLHVAVVSASIADAGAYRHMPADGVDGCAADYPSFLSYRGPYYAFDQDDPNAFADQLGCIGPLGTGARDRNQPLTATLAALTDSGQSSDFLRNVPKNGLSAIGVVVVTDTDDCSTPSDTPLGSPPVTSAACAQRASELSSIEQAVAGLRAVRGDNWNLVVLSVVTGVPPALVDKATQAKVDFTDGPSRQAFYQRILDDPAMQPAVEPDAPDRLRPACASTTAVAEPARRLVELAHGFGANGALTSICADDWRSVLDPFVQFGGGHLGLESVCLPQVQRRPDGSVGCTMYWNLPAPEVASDEAPVHCSDRAFLSPAGTHAKNGGGERCEVPQLVVTSNQAVASLGREDAGWYYDDFSLEAHYCWHTYAARVLLTPAARHPPGVIADIVCTDVQVIATGDPVLDDVAACATSKPSGPRRGTAPTPWVGDACMPALIPQGGFVESSVHVETGSGQCLGGVCLVHHLAGDPQPDCVPREGGRNEPAENYRKCASAEEVANRIHCSCRCRADDPLAGTCICPQGFACRDLLDYAGPELDGGYCVKDGTFDQSQDP